MSLAEFQRALADLISTPQLVLAARRDSLATMADYELDARERKRIAAMVLDRGMSANCTLYRVMRLTPIYSVLPLTCRWLGEHLQPELDGFWRATQDATIQFGREAKSFAGWLESGVATGRLNRGPFEDALRFELACFELKTTPRSRAGAAGRGNARKRTLKLSYPLDVILKPQPSRDWPPVLDPVWIEIDASGDALQVSLVLDDQAHAARILSD